MSLTLRQEKYLNHQRPSGCPASRSPRHFTQNSTHSRQITVAFSPSLKFFPRPYLFFTMRSVPSAILLTFLSCMALLLFCAPTHASPVNSSTPIVSPRNVSLSNIQSVGGHPNALRRAVLALKSAATRQSATPSSSGLNIQLHAPPPALSSLAAAHSSSRLFDHFDLDKDGLLNEKEVAALLKLLTKKKKDDGPSKQARPTGTHDISIDGETISVGAGEFELLFKQLSNLKHTKDPSKDPRMTLQEDIVFIKDLVIVFLAATVGGVIATNFRQPPLIGFLLGGMTVGPGGFGVVTELVEVETLASLGISFLLFCLGIEFSLTELHGVRRVVFAGGLSSTCGVVVATATLSLMLSLVNGIPEAIALGLAVSLSSTAVVLQCLPSSHATSPAPPPTSSSSSTSSSLSPTMPQGHPDAPPSHDDTLGDPSKYPHDSAPTVSAKLPAFAFDSPRSRKVMLGLLVFQDVMIGLILALLPTLKGTLVQFFEELLSAMLRLSCFVVLSLMLAEFVLPTLSDRLDASKSQEVFTIGCVVFCLAMSYLSEKMGLAIELGAFAAGIMLSESRLKARVEDSISSVRSVFSAVFFISVGMMIHWRYFYQNFAKMSVLLFVILFAKTVVMGAVICTLGQLPLRTAMACGSAIAQAGEFTFVIASKGQALQLFSASEARMINGATALSMLATPYIIRFARQWTARSVASMQRADTTGV